MHSGKIQDGGMLSDLVIFSVKISQEIIKLRKISKGDLHIILKVLPNEIIKKYERKNNQNKTSLYNVGNGLYRVFTTAKRALSFQQKRAFIQEILFSFFKWGTLAQKISLLKKVGGGAHAPNPPPRLLATVPG